MPTSPEQRKLWVNLGWLTDRVLGAEMKALQERLSTAAGMKIPFSHVIRTLLRRGLDDFNRDH